MSSGVMRPWFSGMRPAMSWLALRGCVKGATLTAKAAGRERGTSAVLRGRRLQAQSAYSPARHAYVPNRLLLKQAAGVIEVQDLEAINALLE